MLALVTYKQIENTSHDLKRGRFQTIHVKGITTLRSSSEPSVYNDISLVKSLSSGDVSFTDNQYSLVFPRFE